MSCFVQHLGPGERGAHPRSGSAFSTEPGIPGGGIGRRGRSRLDRKEHEGAGLRLLMPRAYRFHRREIANQHGVRPFPQQTLRELGMLPGCADEIAERSQHAASEAVTDIQKGRGGGCQADALALEHLLPPAQAREAGTRIVAALCEKLDTIDGFSRLVVIAATSRTDAVDPSLVAPGRLDHLVEVPLPDAAAQEQIIALARARAERNAGRPLVGEIDFRLLLPPMGGMSGGEIRDILRRALEEKVHAAGQGQEAGLVTTQDLLRQVDVYRRIRAVVEKIRYGQYL